MRSCFLPKRLKPRHCTRAHSRSIRTHSFKGCEVSWRSTLARTAPAAAVVAVVVVAEAAEGVVAAAAAGVVAVVARAARDKDLWERSISVSASRPRPAAGAGRAEGGLAAMRPARCSRQFQIGRMQAYVI